MATKTSSDEQVKTVPMLSGPQAGARRAGIGLSLLVAADGLVLAVLGAMAPEPLLARGLQVALSLGVLIPGLMLLRLALRRPFTGGLFAGEIELAAVLFYLAVAMPAFHAAHASYALGAAQFVLVLTGLVLGCAVLALAGAVTPSAEERGKISLLAAIRDGVTLIVATILLAIGTSQFAGAALMPPKWNWISFGGITVPGMLLLIARELVKQYFRRGAPDGRVSLVRLALTETMLIVGLAVMVYGSGANLTLGANGYTTGVKGNPLGLAVLVAAAVFLVLVRGGARLALGGRGAMVRWALVGNLALALGVVVFIYGERSVVMGKSPLPSFGDAVPAAAPFVVAGLLLLIFGRLGALTNAAAPTADAAPSTTRIAKAAR
ncbi:MAG: hypothetical protein ACRDR6_08780 [Pseudonocardiaceae bacterium]